MNKLVFFLSIFIVFSCAKTEDPTPTPAPTPVPVCKISTETGRDNAYKLEYVYSADGFIESMNISTKDNATAPLKLVATIKYSYENSRLVKVVDGLVEEKLEYATNGVLTRLTVVKTDEPAYLNYTLNFETDANQRIVKITDSKGIQTTIKRDAKGNISETITTNTSTNKEIYRVVLSDYDNKKSLSDSFRGWPFNILGYYGNYIKTPIFNIGAGGNYVKRTDYKDGKATEETTYTYTYNSNGFPLTEQSLTKFLDGSGISTYARTFIYTGCQ